VEVPRQLRFQEDDLRDLLASRPAPDEELTYDFDPRRPWQNTWAFLRDLPRARALHAERGLSDDDSWATLQDLPRHAHLDRQLHGTPGLRKGWWVRLAWEGRLFELGRLQFEPREGRLNVHIPEAGPLTPADCDDSLARARRFFAERVAECHSWLLDPQLADYLTAASNIVRFQRRFEPIRRGEAVDESVLEFVFHRIRPDLDDLPQETALQRAIVGHLRSGGHWYLHTGRLEL
jgi:hypothetical protein